MRLFFALVLVVLIVLSLIAGILVPPRTAAGKIPLIWVSDLNPARKEQIAQFNEMFGDYELRLDPNDPNTLLNAQKIIMQSSAGVGPDVFDSWGPKFLQTFVQSGIVADVTDLAKQMGFEYTKTYKAAWPSFVYQGRQYGFPCNAQANVMWINKAVFRKYGVPVPTKTDWTWPEFVEVAKKVTVPRKDGRGYECYGFAGTSNMVVIMQYGGHTYSADGTRCVIDSPEAIAGQTMYFDLMFKHHVQPTPMEAQSLAGEGGWAQGEISMFANGRFAMMRGGRWMLITFRQYYTVGPGEDREPLELTALPLPRAPARDPVVLAGARFALVNADTANLRDACMFLKYLTSERYNRELNRFADGMPPLKAFTKTQEFLVNRNYPQEDFHWIFRDVMEHTISRDVSPFIAGFEDDRIVGYEFARALDRLSSGTETDTRRAAAELLTNAAAEINATIQRNIRRNAAMREEYEKTIAPAKTSR